MNLKCTNEYLYPSSLCNQITCPATIETMTLASALLWCRRCLAREDLVPTKTNSEIFFLLTKFHVFLSAVANLDISNPIATKFPFL
jgi:hypothetical protein